MRILKDCIYGFIKIPDLCGAFIDQPEFQRLRFVRQLGMAHYAYPSASHTRFEHCLGVMHLTGQLAKQLGASARETELLQLAGLYHDIGHFAYSHLFDRVLSDNKNAEELQGTIFQFQSHEDRSVQFLRKVSARTKLLDPQEVAFVECAILGNTFDAEKPWLSQIVHNRVCGVDSDKADFLHRDAYHTGFPAFQSDYILLHAVIDANGNLAFLEKTRRDIEILFETRKTMHMHVYQHSISRKMDRLHYCCMKRLGSKLFQYGERTNDCNINTLIRESPECQELVEKMDSRDLEHDCALCHAVSFDVKIPDSGNVGQTIFV